MAYITAKQISKIYTMGKALKQDPETLHIYVENITGKSSISALTKAEATKVIDELSGEDGKGKKPKGSMSDGQFDYMKGLAIDLGWVNEKGILDKNRLLGFVRERFKIDSFEWVTSAKASQIIEALKAMKKRAEEIAI